MTRKIVGRIEAKSLLLDVEKLYVKLLIHRCSDSSVSEVLGKNLKVGEIMKEYGKGRLFSFHGP